MLRNRGLGAWGIQQAEVGQAVANGDSWEAQRRAKWLSYADIRSEKAERNPDKHFLEGVDILMQATDKEDMYLIYKLITLSLMGSQIMYYKAVHQWLSWQLI